MATVESKLHADCLSVVASLTFDQLQTLLPEAYEELRQYCDILPHDEPSPAYPFTGVVVNLNVSTLGHRDKGDKNWCVVVCVSDCEGGALVCYELGLVIELQCGDAVIFRSADITHFNLHYLGRRASVVFHSDKSFDAWLKDRNGWQTHNMFCR
jgi:hypothetical protein